ncbi:hypothetical protein BKA70DRAFT_721105, partial [Coprinopsis sp. MPI-PUGE-AT-0042]
SGATTTAANISLGTNAYTHTPFPSPSSGSSSNIEYTSSENIGLLLHTMAPIVSQIHDENNTPPPIEGSSIFGRCKKIVLNNCHITNCAGAHSPVSHNVHPPRPPIFPLQRDDSNEYIPPPADQSGATGPTQFGLFTIASGRRIVAVALTIALVVGFVLW